MSDWGSQAQHQNEEENEHKEEEQEQVEEEPMVKVEKPEEKQPQTPYLHLLTEAVLVCGGIPFAVFFILGIINGLLLLVERTEYDV